MRGVPALASAFPSPSGSSWWLRASVRALASCHVVLAPPLSFFLRSSETEQPGSTQLLGTCRHSSFLPVPLASHSPPGFGCVPSGRCMTPPLAFLLHLRSWPRFTAREDPILAWGSGGLCGLQPCFPSHSCPALLAESSAEGLSRGCSELGDRDWRPFSVWTISVVSGSNPALHWVRPPRETVGGSPWDAQAWSCLGAESRLTAQAVGPWLWLRCISCSAGSSLM